ncbi:MAG: dipeptidase PepE [Opitutales bacterium]|nr:dipeptidase PepE [Opitutales bacterium]
MNEKIKQNRKLLLGSGGIGEPDRMNAWRYALSAFLQPKTTILFIPYAIADYDAYLKRIREFGLCMDFPIVSIHDCADPVQAIEGADAVFVGGGNSFRLLHTLYRLGLIDSIRKHVSLGKPYMGISAGTNMSCPTLMTTNDMPIIMPPSFNSFDLIPFQINPHYMDGAIYLEKNGEYVPHRGETRDLRIQEYLEENKGPVLGIREGEILHVSGYSAKLCGLNGAKLFKKGECPQEIAPESDLSYLLQ